MLESVICTITQCYALKLNNKIQTLFSKIIFFPTNGMNSFVFVRNKIVFREDENHYKSYAMLKNTSRHRLIFQIYVFINDENMCQKKLWINQIGLINKFSTKKIQLIGHNFRFSNPKYAYICKAPLAEKSSDAETTEDINQCPHCLYSNLIQCKNWWNIDKYPVEIISNDYSNCQLKFPSHCDDKY